jgi:hypothetical protein
MARVARLAGALLAETEKRYFLVGELKEPCDFQAAGFEPPGPIDAKARPFIALHPVRAIELSSPRLLVELEGEALAIGLADRLLIERNAAVSDRLWRAILDGRSGDVEAAWLLEIPRPLWQVVRDGVLKCS